MWNKWVTEIIFWFNFFDIVIFDIGSNNLYNFHTPNQ